MSPPSEKRGGTRMWSPVTRKTAIPVLFVLAVAIVIRTAGLRFYEVPGDSMRPTLRRGDVLVATAVRSAPSRGDIVVFREPGQNISVVKRVIGIPGDHVLVRERSVFLNGQLLVEPYADARGVSTPLADLVPPRHFWLMGDNRADSRDSRTMGPVAMARIESRVRLVLFSRQGDVNRFLRRVR